MFTYFNKVFTASLAVFLLQITPVFGQTVTVQSGDSIGHGLLLRHATTCYVVIPKHVAAGKRRVTVFSSAPVVHSGALVETPFWQGMDLALGVVRGKAEQSCTMSLDDLSGRVQADDGRKVQLLRLRNSGEIERLDMVITRSSYLTLEARVVEAGKELFKGTSGSFLFDGEKPIGMITEAISATEGRFMRIEEIHMNLERKLNRQIGFQTARGTATETSNLISDTNTALPFEFVSATQPPTYPDFAEENLMGDGAYVFELPRPNRIAFKVIGKDSVSLSGLKLVSEAQGDYALPRNISVDVSSAPDGSRPRPFGAGEMGPDGVFDLPRSPTLVRWVYVTINSAWEGGALGLERIQFR